MYHSAVYDEPLLNELIGNKKEKPTSNSNIPKSLQKEKSIEIPNLDETQVVRHFHHLSQMNYGVDSGIYPLGSCTMKYNPRICEQIASCDKILPFLSNFTLNIFDPISKRYRWSFLFQS